MLIFKILHYSLAQQNAPGSCCTFSFFFLSLPPSLSVLSFFLCKPYSFLQEYSLVLFFVLFFLVMGMVYRDHILSIASDHCYWNFQWWEAENIFLNLWANIDISNKNMIIEFLLKLSNFILVSIFNLKILFLCNINIITYFIMKYIKVSK